MASIEVQRTYLQMIHRNELIRARVEDERLRIEQLLECPVSFFRYLYREVGRQYHWVDRLNWTDEQIRHY
ncbi:MAG TPA: hypothetical protein V6C85_04600, partial [Allocoleopsis sp.]